MGFIQRIKSIPSGIEKFQEERREKREKRLDKRISIAKKEAILAKKENQLNKLRGNKKPSGVMRFLEHASNVDIIGNRQQSPKGKNKPRNPFDF